LRRPARAGRLLAALRAAGGGRGARHSGARAHGGGVRAAVSHRQSDGAAGRPRGVVRQLSRRAARVRVRLLGDRVRRGGRRRRAAARVRFAAARGGSRCWGAGVSRTVRAPHGTELSCQGWPQEAALRMLMNNLDPDVAEDPDNLVVYGGTGRAARSWKAFDAIVRSLQSLASDETLLVQSGKPVGVFRTHEWAPRVLIANSNLVPDWATWDEFRRLEALGLTMYGQMTAGSWIYIGTQGIVQGTYECFAEIARRKYGG